MTKPILTQARLKEVLHYNPDTGAFTWLKSRRSDMIGKKAGYKVSTGYIHIEIASQSYKAHRLAFLYMVGDIPKYVDHINHNRDDNSWLNVREASRADNARNASRAKTNTSGVTGVHWHISLKKWYATIYVSGKHIALGYYHDFDRAVDARNAANIKYNFHPNHGRA